MMVTSTAPGKLVLTGEYAVLNGAPAVVLAVNRRASAMLKQLDTPSCTFNSKGLDAQSRYSLSRMLSDDPPQEQDPARLGWYVIRQLLNSSHLSKQITGFSIKTDSSHLFDKGQKLGLGSSAAICACLTANLMAMFGNTVQPKPDRVFDVAFAAHYSAQNSRGSGLDIAAACYGGVICYTNSISGARIVPTELPSNMFYQIFNSGQAASTNVYLEKFSSWLQSGPTHSLDKLSNSAENIAHVFRENPNDWRIAMSEYIQALQDFDNASQQGIYTQTHGSMNKLALKYRILYKPCGAGGGDLGIALAEDPEVLHAFTTAVKNTASTTTFQNIDLEIDSHGVHTDSSQAG
jgi:phosphomevalonate kinase